MMTGEESRAGRWSRARNLLCVRLDTAGDVLMTTPAIRALKESVPGRRVTLLTSSRGAEIAPLVPEVDGVIAYDSPWMRTAAADDRTDADMEVVRRLKEGRFDGAVIFTVYSQSPLPAALLCYLAEIPLRIAHCHENPYRLLTDWLPDPEPQTLVRHEVQRQLDLVAATGARTENDALSLRVPPGALSRVAALLGQIGIDTARPWVVLHPGASAESRRYPWQGFAKAARTLVREDGWQVVLTGTEQERELTEAIRCAMSAPACNLAGRLTLAGLCALISLAPLLISNNTAPVHIAAALGTPVVDLYALTNPQHTPWRVPNRTLFHDVPCKYCHKSVCPEGHHRCLRMVLPEAIVRAARELLAETHPEVTAGASQPAVTPSISAAQARGDRGRERLSTS